MNKMHTIDFSSNPIKGQDKRVFPVLLLPNEEGIMEKINGVLLRERTVTAVLLAVVSTAGWANDGQERHFQGTRFQGTLQATSKFYPPGNGEDRCNNKGQPTLRAQGSGDTNLFGSVYIEQSHCVGVGGAFTDGVFKLRKSPPSKKTPLSPLVEGVYCGQLEETFNSTKPPTTPTPQGTWLIAGNVCIKKVQGQLDGHCGQPADCSEKSSRYQPARGITNLTNGLDGPATIFIDQMIRFK